MGVVNKIEILDGISQKALQSELTWFGDRHRLPLCPSSCHGWNYSNPLGPVRHLEDGR